MKDRMKVQIYLTKITEEQKEQKESVFLNMASAVSRIDERHEFSQSGSKEVLRRIKVTPRHITQNKEKILNEWRQNS